MKLPIAFGQVVRKWRLARKLSQAELAELSLLDRTFISLLERGERQPTLNTIFALSGALKMTPAEMIRQTDRKAKYQDLNERRALVVSRRL
jgi:transcriptional regulator with XRE-family HTH domain